MAGIVVKVGDLGLGDLAKQLDQVQEDMRSQWMEQVAKNLAARLLRKVILTTPVGQYPEKSGKVGGTLRRGWIADTEEEAKSKAKENPNDNEILAYVNAMSINKSGDQYVIEVFNPVHYSPYVEYGHRTRGGKGWVEGTFMLTISEEALKSQAPAIVEKMLKKKLREAFP